jgi:predicted HicB family RNase H-like nuclease
MATENLIPMTVRLYSAVNAAFALKAKASGQEIADYAADVLTRDVIDQLKPTDAERIRAELELKTKAIKYAREQTAEKFDEHVTLKVFQQIRQTPELRDLYVRAIGGESPDAPFVRGNQTQARINRTLGAAIKIAVHARRKTVNGNVLKAQVAREFILGYTVLELDPSGA